jgi:acetyl esterase/lipase
MKTASHLAILSLVALTAQAQQTNSFPIWPDGAPGALGKEDKDTPTLTPFLSEPAHATGAAMVICPGGGYARLSEHEGAHYAKWLNTHGIAGFVLKYRLGTNGYRHPAMLQDAARAVRTVRARAGEWQVDPTRIGIMGSSAGGHLASTLLTHFDAGQPGASDPIQRESSRPDLGILCYPVINMTGEFTHQGSKRNLLGSNAPPELAREVSSERHVAPDTPPCFLWHTWEDKSVPVENTLQFAQALRQAKVPFDLHIYERGGHGLGLGGRTYDPSQWHPWTRDCEFWLKQRGFAR